MTAGGVGTVHSHPTPDYRPSKADLALFAKKGIIHLIIRYPYTQGDIACYDNSGNRCEFEPLK
jgi:proteasome lid subunit RPN8/RPN11